MCSIERNDWNRTTDSVIERQIPFHIFMRSELMILQKQALSTNLVKPHELFESNNCFINSNQIVNCAMQTNHQTSTPRMSLPNYLNYDGWSQIFKISLIVILCLIIGSPISEYILGTRCFVPNNYLIWEATRPISDCRFCEGIQQPIILGNMTQEEFLVRVIAKKNNQITVIN